MLLNMHMFIFSVTKSTLIHGVLKIISVYYAIQKPLSLSYTRISTSSTSANTDEKTFGHQLRKVFSV